MMPNPIVIIFTLALVVIFGSAVMIFPTNGHVRAAADATATFRDLIQEAHDIAAVSGGATIEVQPAADGSQIDLYGGRPDGVRTYTHRDMRLTHAPLSFSGTTAFAVFMSSSGSATASAYVHGAVAVAGTACVTTLTVSVAVTPAQDMLMTCADARFN